MAQPSYELNVLPEASRFCNRCGAGLAPPGLFCPACGHSPGQPVNGPFSVVITPPSMNHMIQSGSTDAPPPMYDRPASAPYDQVGAPRGPYDVSAPAMGQPFQPYGIQPTMGHPPNGMVGQPPAYPHQLMQGLPMGQPLGGLPMGQPLGLPMGQPLGQPFEFKGPAYPSPTQPDSTVPPPGDWKSMRSPFPVLTLPRLWITREADLSLVPLARRDQEIRCLQFVHEPGVNLPEGLSVTHAGHLVGQPTTASQRTEYYFMARLQTGLSGKEKAKRRAAREKEHKKLVKNQKKQHEQAQRKSPNNRAYEAPAMAQPGPEETDEIKWVLMRVRIGVVSRLKSFLLSTFCRGIPCLFVSPMVDEAATVWLVPCFGLITLPFSIFVDLPCKLAALFFLVVAIPFFAVVGLLQNNFPESIFDSLATAEGCCGGVDQEGTRQVQAAQMAQARAGRSSS